MVDAAWTNPNLVAAVGVTGTNDGGFSTDDGLTWTEYSSKPSGISGGTVAITTDGTGSSIGWASSISPIRGAFFSTNNGGTWVPSSNGTSVSITSLTRSGTTATAVTSAANGLVMNQTIHDLRVLHRVGTTELSSLHPSPAQRRSSLPSVSSLATPATGTITAVEGLTPGGKDPYPDRVTPGDFYYYVNNQIWFSSNNGAAFVLESSTAQTSAAIVVNPFTTGDLWIAASGGVYHSSNFGTTWTHVGTQGSSDSRIALGGSGGGQTVPAIYIRANIGGFLGFDRSDDGGLTWVTINDVSHQWGGYPTFDNGGQFGLMAADPKVFGRVYLATNGRGVIVGNPASSLPAGWTDQDINTPGNPGWATSSTTLSTGTVINQWTVNGGGAGITGTSDQFNFCVCRYPSGSGSLVARRSQGCPTLTAPPAHLWQV